MGYVLAFLRFLTYIVIFIIFILIGIAVHILFFLSQSERFKWISFFTHYWAKITCWILNFQFEIHGEKSYRPGSLIVANHVGTPDVFILGALTKGFFVSKAEILDWPFFNFLAWLGMTIFADRKNKMQVRSIIKKMETRLNSNCSVIIFPEAQATDGTDVIPFKSAVFESAVRAQAPVIPVTIKYHDGNQPTIAYYGDSFFKHMLTLLKNPRLCATVFVLPAIVAGTDRSQLARSSYNAVRDCYRDVI
ncbi:MAG: 1-acyl-sn-glycerol-3-phosphate acyltransferase [Nitrospina sp.]|nr:1-acyl-sn-glycerol-3-phosphate acyltransferase [Nitrospina sp.]|tara:strand:- start:3466 stop:4209 length:744 start_codon:yes stop_codon:yes gene_type:complete